MFEAKEENLGVMVTKDPLESGDTVNKEDEVGQPLKVADRKEEED